MKHVRLLIAGFLFFFLQMVLVPKITIGEISPDLPLLLVAYFAIKRGPLHGAILGFVLGLFQDLFYPELLGLNALTKSLTGYALGVMGAKGDPENDFFLLMLFVVAAAAHDFVYLLFFTGLNVPQFFGMWTTISVPSALYTALVGVLVHRLAMSVEARVVRTFGKARS